MKTPTLALFAFLTVSRVRLALALAVIGSVVALLLLGWCFKLSRDPRKLPIILFTGVIPLFLLALIWPQFRLPIFASLAALLLLSCCFKRARRALHLLLTLFTGLIPLFLLIGVEDASWSAGFLLVYLGLLSLEPRIAHESHPEGGNEMIAHPAVRRWYLIYYVSLGFLWILMFAALLWYVPDPATGA